jgi:hypothetical protein
MLKPHMIKTIENMVIDDKLAILRFLQDQKIKIIESNEGSHINLDKLEADVYVKLVAVVELISSRKILSKHLI